MAIINMGVVRSAVARKPAATKDWELVIIFEQGGDLKEYVFRLPAEEPRVTSNLRDDLSQLLVTKAP